MCDFFSGWLFLGSNDGSGYVTLEFFWFCFLFLLSCRIQTFCLLLILSFKTQLPEFSRVFSLSSLEVLPFQDVSLDLPGPSGPFPKHTALKYQYSFSGLGFFFLFLGGGGFFTYCWLFGDGFRSGMVSLFLPLCSLLRPLFSAKSWDESSRKWFHCQSVLLFMNL